MIKLKNGFKIAYNNNFDEFFQNIIESIINESLKYINNLKEKKHNNTINELLLKEIMDNCIYVSHQVFQMTKVNENLAKFLITGCLFNCIVLTFHNSRRFTTTNIKNENSIH